MIWFIIVDQSRGLSFLALFFWQQQLYSVQISTQIYQSIFVLRIIRLITMALNVFLVICKNQIRVHPTQWMRVKNWFLTWRLIALYYFSAWLMTLVKRYYLRAFTSTNVRRRLDINVGRDIFLKFIVGTFGRLPPTQLTPYLFQSTTQVTAESKMNGITNDY